MKWNYLRISEGALEQMLFLQGEVRCLDQTFKVSWLPSSKGAQQGRDGEYWEGGSQAGAGEDRLLRGRRGPVPAVLTETSPCRFHPWECKLA